MVRYPLRNGGQQGICPDVEGNQAIRFFYTKLSRFLIKLGDED